ncbi:class I SAM-dependent methyltransferase [Brachyspira pilosicoli]|uniref:class I SAM-dependent methyltransferase n=1 Tax=Brachyspira pilosicoli TaxID=52584 RepID=UPI0025431916|nr:class I SAM-dependent methyltransferase [Brachyspira pilosicoli]WIH87735.1 class I SAM-dependent methyltransferase [Brachyspira pilosicoli]
MIYKPDKFENFLLDDINYFLEGKSEMSHSDRCFLNGIIRQLKPNKILEVGVAAGGSSAIILNAIKDIENSKLYSVDYNINYYKDNSKKSGFIVEEYLPQLISKWELYTGGVVANFLDDIGHDIDLCLIDTMHINPGEFLDFLAVLPYLKENAVIILHDTGLYGMNPNKYPHRYNCVTNGILFSTLKGKKIFPNDFIFGNFGNIGAVILDSDIKNRIIDYFYLLTLPWSYLPSDKDILSFQKLFQKHYNSDIINIFTGIILYNKELLLNNKILNSDNCKISDEIDNINMRLSILDYKISIIINKMAWWIPVKKWRENFRDKFKIRPDQTRPDQTRPDQTRIICNGYIYIYNNMKYQKLQPMLQYAA